MCLCSKYKKPFIAKEDIKCYKRLHVDWVDGDIIITTPYFNVVVNKEVRVTKELKPSLWSRIRAKWNYFWDIKYSIHKPEFEIGEGYIHAYNIPIQRIKKEREFAHCNNCILLECIIPKGCKYYKDMSRGTFAAEKLVIIESNENIEHYINIIDNMLPYLDR